MYFVNLFLFLASSFTIGTPNAMIRNDVYKSIMVPVSPYSTYEEALADEKNINWSTEAQKANAITTAYAGLELKSHFELLGKKVKVLTYNKNKTENHIVLVLREVLFKNHPKIAEGVNFENLGGQGFSIIPHKNTIYITANSRIGLLYGSYGLLKRMGFAWYNPTETIIPQKVNKKPSFYKISKSAYLDFRGFWTFSEENLSVKRVQWLARNRFNIAGKTKNYLAKKLGIKIWGGEHNLIQEEFSKEGLFKLHPEWYTLHENQHFKVKSKGNYTNPSFANKDAAEFFADRMIERLATGNLSHIDILNIWPADRRSGRLDQSQQAKEVGNFTDTLLFFYSIIADRLQRAYDDGVLKRKVTLAGISYHLTLEPPTNTEVIEKLESQNYLHIFYPSTRDWSYAINQSLDQSDANKRLYDSFNEWQKRTNFKHGVVAYNNKSNYSAIALTDHINFGENFSFYFPKKGGLYAYMHPIKDNPGPLQLTNALIAELAWKSRNEEAKSKALEVIDLYFNKRYGKFAKDWKGVYDLMSVSVSNAKNIFESESLNTVLFQDMYWADPPFTMEEVVTFIPYYRKGGPQKIPNGFEYKNGSTSEANFIGLDRSIEIQSQMKIKWNSIIEKVKDQKIKARMQNDIDWFEATNRRYVLMALCSDYIIAEFNGNPIEELKNQIRSKIAYLEKTKVTNDAVSPVNQRVFLEVIKKRIGFEKK